MGVCKVLLVLSIVTAVLFAIWINWFLNKEGKVPNISQDGYWGSAALKNTKEDTSVRPFEINVAEDVLTDLRSRLQNTIYQTDLEDGSFDYGFQVSYMKKIVKHWQNDFNWRKQEKLLNTFNHFKTKIEGLDVHFIHAKPKNPSGKVFPILLVHGWPGSFWEFYKVIPMLTQTADDIAFEVICPSIPGYGFSDAPKKTGFDSTDVARVFLKLMERLGHKQFFVQGGDFGAVVVHNMAVAYPEHILGHHNNMFQIHAIMSNPFKLLLGAWFPSLVLGPNETTTLYPLSKTLTIVLKESAYNYFQSTRPDTISMGLTDSPVGLAAYIIDKFCSCWRSLREDKGCVCDLTQYFTIDEVLTDVMIYWVNRNFVSSARFYKELFLSEKTIEFSKIPCRVPTGLAQFPGEAVHAPRSFAEGLYTNLVQFSEMPAGGHFAALEEPRLLADDIISFVRKTVNSNTKNK